jgi:uncharacterized protein YggE
MKFHQGFYQVINMRTIKLTILLGMMLLAILLSACSESQNEPTPSGTPPPRNITVSGSGKVYLIPDVAAISIGVHSEDESAAKAVNDNNNQDKQVSEILLSMDAVEDDILTINEFGGVPVPVFEGKGSGEFDTTKAQVPVSLGQLNLTVDVSVIYDI